MSLPLLLLIHAAATWFMTGLIWFVQVVHYPMFDRVGEAGYVTYQADHMRLTTWVVGPAMLVEGITATGLIILQPEGIEAWVLWLGLGLLVMIWLSTALIQVPCHHRLSISFDPQSHRRLVRTNWLRTTGWSLRSILVGWMLHSSWSVQNAS